MQIIIAFASVRDCGNLGAPEARLGWVFFRGPLLLQWLCLDELVSGGARPRCAVRAAVPAMGPGVPLGPGLESCWPNFLLWTLSAAPVESCSLSVVSFSHPFPASCYWFFSQLPGLG